MHKIYITTVLLFIISINCFGQTKQSNDSLSVNSVVSDAQLEAALDSLLNKLSSYFQVGFGIGNQLYSSHNHALNAKQISPPFVLTPTIGYFNKSGFNITANEYLLSENKTFGANQYSITPDYETQPGSKFDFLISYTRYFVNNEYSEFSSPIQNDFYSSLVYKKKWLQPGLALGYSTGESKAVVHLDTIIGGKNRALYDSITNNLKIFSTILSVQHNFGWESVLSKADSISFIPILMLNFGSSTNNIINDDNLTAVLNSIVSAKNQKTIRTALSKKINKLSRLQTTAFGVQSLGVDLEGSYTIGNFDIEPDVYLDYYLPQTNQKRFTQVFVVNFNYSF